MKNIKGLFSTASEKVDYTLINVKNRISIATSDKREALDTTAIGMAVVGIVLCAGILFVVAGKGDGSDSSVLGLFKEKILDMVKKMFGKGESVLG